jgi:lysine decarboxylase/arginine decarboxylase
MLDPIKSTIVTPGLDLNGKFAKTGIPASIVTKFLAEHGVIVEKTGLYSFFILFTIGITKGRWNTLLSALQQFKDDYAKNQPMWRILPEFCQQFPRYERMGLADLCQYVHELYAKYDIAKLSTDIYLSDLQPAMKPSDAFAHIAHRKTDRVEIDELEGRITTALITPYPPGIPLLIPGEVFNKKIVDYLKFARAFNEECPRLRDGHPWPGGRGRAGRQAAVLRGLREGGSLIRGQARKKAARGRLLGWARGRGLTLRPRSPSG